MHESPAAPERASPLGRHLAVAALALAGLALHLSPWGARANAILLDMSFGLSRALDPKPAPDDIVVVGLPSQADVPTADRGDPGLRKLPDILARIAKGRPRAVALDVTLPRGSLDDRVPGYDDALAAALAITQATAPLVVRMSVDSRGDTMPIHGPLLRGVDSRALAFGLLPRDDDGVVRRAVTGLPTQKGHWPTLAGWLCEVLEGRCADGLIDFALGRPYGLVPAHKLLEMRDEGAITRLFQGRIVFVASVTQPEDRLPMPVALAGWEAPARAVPAVLGHAQTLRTWLHGEPIREAPLPLTIVVIALAALVAQAGRTTAPAIAALVLGGGAAFALTALRWGHHLPLAAPLATLLAAFAIAAWAGRRVRER